MTRILRLKDDDALRRLREGMSPVEKASKYHNVRTEVDGLKFASKREAQRYGELKLDPEVTHLERQVRFKLEVNGIECGEYVLDFRFRRKGKVVHQDVKGDTDPSSVAYRLFKLKSNLMKAIYGITVEEV